MGPAAHVTATNALVDFRAMLCTFADQAKEALGMVDHEVRQTFAFLHDRKAEWQAAARQAEDEVIQAKIELSQRRLQRIGDRQPDTTYQEKVVRRAEAKLEFAQMKLAATMRWLRDLPHELTAYEGPARQLQNTLESELPRMISYLDNKLAALESYMRQELP